VSTSRLAIYSGALLLCGERSLASLTENREPRRALDEVWNDGGVHQCLEQGQWKFAMNATQFDYDPSIAPSWGYHYGVTKPSDWCATSAVCSDEYFRAPILAYEDSAGVWWCDLQTIYVRYVSDDTLFGLNLANWPATFTDYVKAYFASRIIVRISNDQKRWAAINEIVKHNLGVAKNKDAMAGPALVPPPGSWNQARTRGTYRRDGGGTSGSLIG